MVFDHAIIEDCIRCLETCPQSRWENGDQSEETFTLGKRIYAPEIQKLFQYLEKCAFYDPHYVENIQKLRNKNISQLTLNDCCTWMTYIYQGENVQDGHIQFYVQNQFLLNLLRHFLSLLV